MQTASCKAEHSCATAELMNEQCPAGLWVTGDRELIKSGPRESLASDLAVFAAERARLNGGGAASQQAWMMIFQLSLTV